MSVSEKLTDEVFNAILPVVTGATALLLLQEQADVIAPEIAECMEPLAAWPAEARDNSLDTFRSCAASLRLLADLVDAEADKVAAQ